MSQSVNETAAAGYVYLLANSTMPGLIKVGRTARNPQDRVGELSSATGVAAPFHLIYHVFVRDAPLGERIAHQRL